jgi:hypothetical protein
MDYWISEGYGLCVKLPHIPTWSLQNSMGFWRVWVIGGMGYERVDCISIQSPIFEVFLLSGHECIVMFYYSIRFCVQYPLVYISPSI